MIHAGKHALVTGGGTGIGLAIAQALAAQGAQVTITGRRADVLEQAAGNGLHPLVMDVMHEDQLRDGIAQATAARGPFQIVIANAGIAEGKSLQKTELEFWQRIMRTNLDGAFLTIRESMRGMLGTDWGRVIVVSSLAGLRGLKGAGAYSASKHGVIGLIRSYSEEYMGGPITFNALCPGYIETEINRDFFASDAGQTLIRRVPQRRLGQPEDLDGALLLLASDLSRFMTGTEIVVDGGHLISSL
jgi:NAD(P)-dependent dehydrogenase (short-subunit alcohol dehydrogenase family)